MPSFPSLFLALILLTGTAPVLFACDACGGPGSQFVGILPQFHRHFAGMRWHYRSFRMAHSPTEAPIPERFATFEAWGRFYPVRRLQLFAFVPYNYFARQVPNAEAFVNHGLGDLSVTANYLLLDTGDSLYASYKQTLSIGGGLKLPTGRFRDRSAEGQTLHPNLQMGSGSVDFLLSANYTLRRGRFGANAEVGARLSTPNADGYRLGHRANAAVRAFWWQPLGRGCALMPQAGLLYDYGAQDRQDGHRVSMTGGGLLAASVGLDLYLGPVLLGASGQLPLASSLNGGMVSPGPRCTVQMAVMF
jgi:hypothetical protein